MSLIHTAINIYNKSKKGIYIEFKGDQVAVIYNGDIKLESIIEEVIERLIIHGIKENWADEVELEESGSSSHTDISSLSNNNEMRGDIEVMNDDNNWIDVNRRKKN